jgi:serine protease Do
MVLVKAGNRINSGSGFVVRSSGLFVTNHHVIDGAQEIAVKLNNNDKVIYADLIKTDPQKDIALLQLRDAVSYPVLQLEENFAPNLGDDVIVLGYPLGIKLGLEITVSTGIISSTRALPEVNLIQTNAAINHGNSGGPMISRRSGKVIGIVTAKARDSESIGFAINVNELKQILENTR